MLPALVTVVVSVVVVDKVGADFSREYWIIAHRLGEGIEFCHGMCVCVFALGVCSDM